jgi:hypothetical protein
VLLFNGEVLVAEISMDWENTKQVLQLWVKLRECLLDYCKQETRSINEVTIHAGDLVVQHEAPLSWIERLVFTVTKMIPPQK